MFANYANENPSAKMSFAKFEILRLKKGKASYLRIFFCVMLFFVAFANILYHENFPLYSIHRCMILYRTVYYTKTIMTLY